MQDNPVPPDDLPVDQAPDLDPALEEERLEAERQRREDQLQAFGTSLSRQRDDWISARHSMGVDRRWRDDNDQYDGRDSVNRAESTMMDAVEQGGSTSTSGRTTPHRSTVFIGMTRQKTNAAEARVCDILLPTDDRNWGIQPTPDPHLASMTSDTSLALDPATGQPVENVQTGQPATKRDIARAVMAEARKKAEAMQTEIDDQLVEADYNGELRKVIHDAAVLGTGVIKGPIVMNRVRRAWTPYTDAEGNTVQQMQFVEELAPASFRVDPRNVWPDPGCGENIHNGKGVFEREQMTRRQVRDLAKQPGYMRDQIRKVLEEGPKTSAVHNHISDEDLRDSSREVYEMWTWWGEVDLEDLEAAGVELPEDYDELDAVSACVVMINSTVVKAFLNPLEGGELPYDFFVWEKVAGSCWGYGIPYLMRSQQRVLNAAWRQMMDNSGVTSGPQIIFNPTLIKPADGQYQLSPRKIWYATDSTEDVRKAFHAVDFNNHQAEIAAIIKMASELADQETGVPVIMQGEKGAAPDTVGGMQMLMTSANVVLRRLVKQFDDMVTRPHIRRYYDYNMAHGEDEEIKGDFVIDARGSSSLIVRDIQNQAMMNLLAAGANPIYGIYLDTQKLFERALQAQHVDPKEVFKSDEEIEQIKQQQAQAAQQQQPDPRIAAAQIRAQTDIQRVQAQNEGDLLELQTRLQIAREKAALDREQLQREFDLEVMRLANREKLSIEQVKARLADTAIRERGRKELFAAEQQLKLATGSGI